MGDRARLQRLAVVKRGRDCLAAHTNRPLAHRRGGEGHALEHPAIAVTVKGQDVWLCCEGCKKDIEANPDEYLAKLNGGDK